MCPLYPKINPLNLKENIIFFYQTIIYLEMDFITIPYEVFVNYLFCHLTLKEFTRFLCITKEINQAYDQQELWRLCYLKKKQKTFREKELKKTRRLTWSEFDNMGTVQRGLSQVQNILDHKRCNLIVKNDTDVSYDIIYMRSTPRNNSLQPINEHQHIKPGMQRVIKTYVDHIFEFSHRPETKDNHEKSYKTKYLKIKDEDINNQPYEIESANGQKKEFCWPVVFHLKGETYGEDTHRTIDLNHPFHSMKNFKDFKKQHKKLYASEMKKKDAENKEKEKELKDRHYATVVRMEKFLEKMNEEIAEIESDLEKTTNEKNGLDSYFRR
jgi:hypothetical protein